MKMNDRNNNYKHSAFTIVEIMLLLVVFSLILAGSYSVITRKHKLAPKRTVHGQYICMASPLAKSTDESVSDDNKRNYEIYYQGSTLIRSGFVDKTEKNPNGDCEFDLPKSATYIHVRMVGGGGAGGNSNYNIDNLNIKKQLMPINSNDIDGRDIKYISLVADYDNVNSTTPKTLSPKIYGQDSITPSMGVHSNYVNNKFLNSAGRPMFPAQLFKYIVNKAVIKDAFVFDYGGSGEGGGRYKFVGINKDDFKCAGEQTYHTCFKDFAEQKGYYVTPSETCVPGLYKKVGSSLRNIDSTNDLPKICPELYSYPSFSPNHSTNFVYCGGGKGGIGSVFASKSRVQEGKDPWDFNMYPVVGWRWKNYNELTDGQRTYGKTAAALLNFNGSSEEDLIDFYRNKGEEFAKTIIDWVPYGATVSTSAFPIYDSLHAIKRGEFEMCPEGSNESDCVTIGAAKYLKDSFLYKTNNLATGRVIPKFKEGMEPDFDFTKLIYPRDGYDIQIPRYPVLHDGGLPYFDDNKTTKGVKLVVGESSPALYHYDYSNSNSLDYVDHQDSVGKQGKNLPVDSATHPVNEKLKDIWDDFGSIGENPSCPAIFQSASWAPNTPDSTSKFKSAHYINGDRLKTQLTVCFPNLAFVLHNLGGTNANNAIDRATNLLYHSKTSGLDYIIGREYMGSILPGILQCSDLNPSDDGKVNELNIKQGGFALGVRLYYYSKYITYGEPGKSGEYKDFFTRTANSNLIHIRPGKGGKVMDALTEDATQARQLPGDEQRGGETTMYYNCDINTGKDCMYEEAKGGAGGYSGVNDTPVSKTYEPSDIKAIVKLLGDFENKDKNLIKRYSTNAKKEDCEAIGQNNCDGSYQSEDTKFQAVAPLMNLQDSILPNAFNTTENPFSLSMLGKGGNGSYSLDKCWIVPQYFVIRYGSVLNTNVVGYRQYSQADNNSLNSELYRMRAIAKKSDGTENDPFNENPNQYTTKDNFIHLMLGNQEGKVTGDPDYLYTALFLNDIDTCRAKYTAEGKSPVENNSGEDGKPGAVIVTW